MTLAITVEPAPLKTDVHGIATTLRYLFSYRAFYTVNLALIASTRWRLTPKSDLPKREAERTWVTFSWGLR